MSKLLSARDLLELVQQGHIEDKDETETVTQGTLGRKIYKGTQARRPAQRRNPTPRPQQPRRGPRNTQLIEAVRPRPSGQAPGQLQGQPQDQLQGQPQRQLQGDAAPAVARGPGNAPAAPPVAGDPRAEVRSVDSRNVVPPNWSARPADPALEREIQLRDARGRRTTVQMPRAQPGPKPEASDAEARAREDAPTLELQVAARPTPASKVRTPDSEGESPHRSLSPAQPIRKVSMGVWGRSGEPASGAPAPAAPIAKPAVKVEPGARPRSEPPPESAPVSTLESAGAPPKSSVASMFSWVAQRSDWTPPSSEAPAISSDHRTEPELEAPRPTPPPSVPPPSSMPGHVLARDAKRNARDEARSLIADEPVALSSEETLVLIHYDHTLALDSLAEQTGLSEFRLTRIVANLKKRGVLEEANAPSTAAPPMTPAAKTAPSAAWEKPLDRAPRELSPLGPGPLKPQSLPPPPLPPVRPKSAPPAAPPPASVRTLQLADDEPEEELEAHPTIVDLELPMLSEGRRRTEEYAFTAKDDAPDTETTIVDDESADLPMPAETEFAAVASRDRRKPWEMAKRPSVDPLDAPPPLNDPPFRLSVDDSDEDEDEGTDDLPLAVSVDPRSKLLPKEPKATIPTSTPTSGAAVSAKKDDADAKDDDESATDDEDAKKFDAANVLAHFEQVLMKLGVDERTQLASTSSEKLDLLALAYDREPQVVRALWQNVNITHEHARFAAFHHRTALGLDLIAQSSEFLKDQPTARRLLRNPTISEQLLRRILLPKRLLEMYKATLDRDVAERTRASARSLLRNKFATTDPEDRLELIWKTEGRCLISLSGLSIDSKTAALICSRQTVSMMLVQSFTRFAATPPSVIAHFLKQPLVKRQLHLRNALLKHPNCPSDAKRV